MGRDIAIIGVLVFGTGITVVESTASVMLIGVAIIAVGGLINAAETKKSDRLNRAYERRMHRRIDYRIGADDED